MKRNITLAGMLIATMGAAVGLAAQQPQTAPSQGAPPVARITIVGCLQPTDQSATGANPSATGKGKTSDTKYVLNNAKKTKGSAKDKNGKTSDAQDAKSYRLDADDATLTPEVGHQVEIVAMVEDPDAAVPAGTTGSTTATADSPKLKVESVKMVAVACPPQ